MMAKKRKPSPAAMPKPRPSLPKPKPMARQPLKPKPAPPPPPPQPQGMLGFMRRLSGMPPAPAAAPASSGPQDDTYAIYAESPYDTMVGAFTGRAGNSDGNDSGSVYFDSAEKQFDEKGYQLQDMQVTGIIYNHGDMFDVFFNYFISSFIYFCCYCSKLL